MKVSNLRRKLAATLAASGLLSPAYAADLNTNLVVNPGFENVSLEVNTEGDAVARILDWGGTTPGFAYSHDPDNTQIPDYANGGPLAGGGSFYFYPAQGGNDTIEEALTQDINVSLGATGTLIGSGNATFNLSAYFSTYLTQADRGVVQVDFLNGASVNLGTATVGPPTTAAALSTWTPFANSGLIPVGTQTVRVSSYGIAASGGPDGYTDNIDFRINNSVAEVALEMTVNRDTGNISLSNQTGGPVALAGYSLTSPLGALDPVSWLSIADNYDNGNPGPNQVDTNPWAEATATNEDLTEAESPAVNGAILANNRVVNLGNAWIKHPSEDLVFSYTIAGDAQVRPGILTFTGNAGLTFARGDLNADGGITAADWMVFRTNQHADLSADSLAEAYRRGDLNGDKANNFNDFRAFKILYDEANGVGAFAAMAASVPEPSTMILVSLAGVSMIGAARRANSRRP
jgi:hypothetical protein